MSLSYFKKLLDPSYKLSTLKGLCFFSSPHDLPTYCLLPPYYPWKKALSLAPHPVIWIFPLDPWPVRPTKQMLLSLQPLYFLKNLGMGEFSLFDQRYLQKEDKLYKLPPLQVELTPRIKTPQIQKQDSLLFFPPRNTSLHLKGDSTDRLHSPLYLQTLQNKKLKHKNPLLQAYFRLLSKFEN